MKNKRILTMVVLAAATVVCSCSKNTENEGDAPVAIRLSSELSVQTRGAHQEMDTQFPNGRTVAVYVDKADDDSKLYGKNVLTANGSGGFTGTAMYFPQDGSNVNIYAFHTTAALGDADANYPSSPLTHTVQTDQVSEANYAASDLLYAKETDVAKSTNAVNLDFEHLLSKVQIAVKKGAGEPDLTGATVTIEGTKPQATFTPNKSTSFEITATGDAVVPITIATSLAEGDISTDFTTSVKYHDAIIVPQTVDGGESFIKVVLANSSVLYYKLPAAVTFEKGKKYTYHISVDRSGLTVTSTITPWEAVVGDDDGHATM
jgi:hypothetical protein